MSKQILEFAPRAPYMLAEVLLEMVPTLVRCHTALPLEGAEKLLLFFLFLKTGG
jgi:hypothetical protein